MEESTLVETPDYLYNGQSKRLMCVDAGMAIPIESFNKELSDNLHQDLNHYGIPTGMQFTNQTGQLKS